MEAFWHCIFILTCILVRFQLLLWKWRVDLLSCFTVFFSSSSKQLSDDQWRELSIITCSFIIYWLHLKTWLWLVQHTQHLCLVLNNTVFLFSLTIFTNTLACYESGLLAVSILYSMLTGMYSTYSTIIEKIITPTTWRWVSPVQTNCKQEVHSLITFSEKNKLTIIVLL